ncbi:MAG: DUF885 domain-containing protein, partial [Acidimicrobiia bacterium]|nr:DUF885 domain-containing protein [Acidimicrobiia bacterium]
ERFWTAQMSMNPTQANLYGDHRFDSDMDDVSLETEEQKIGTLQALIAEANAIELGTLESQDRITVELLVHEAKGGLVALEGRVAEFLVDPMIGAHVALPSFAPMASIAEPQHADDIAEKWSKVGLFFDQLAERHRQGVANGRTPPQMLVEKSLEQLDRYLASPVADDPFTKPMAPSSFDEAQEAGWRQRLADNVTDHIRPAVARYRDMVRDEVAPAARSNDIPGVGHIPGGAELYKAAIANYTSLDIEAEEIHQTGLDLIARLEDEYRDLGQAALSTSDLDEIYSRLRDDPELRYDSSADVMKDAERAVADAEAESPDWFGTLPQQRCRVMAIPELEAKEAPLAYYMPAAGDGSRPGMFFINSSDPSKMTRYESEALAFHEGVPGHHFQLTIALEIEELPIFRKNALLHAYVEGWGLYTERLADEMGLYSNDLARMGMLSFDSWRAGRLVVDTGLHAMGWSRQQAIDYLAAHSPQQQSNIENEVDRYIGYFGQAVSYMTGRLEIERLRDDAKARLGHAFDIKQFHDVVLGSGPLTLPVLGRLVEEWVSSTAA